MDWQPIETAPKDGGQVLLYPNCIVGCYDMGADDWLVMLVPLSSEKTIAEEWSGAPVMFYEVYAGDWGHEPTHWMPLPEPPK